MAIAEIHVTLKPSLFDAQGATVLKALHHLGYGQMVRDVRIGKYITVEVPDGLTGTELQQSLDAMCQQLLANTVIENYEITLNATAGAASTVSALAGSSVVGGAVAAATGVLPTPTRPDPFAMDYDVYESLPATEQMAVQEAAWQMHGAWILQQLQERRAVWILCIGGTVVEAGETMDTFPSAARLDELGTANELVPLVFVRPPG